MEKEKVAKIIITIKTNLKINPKLKQKKPRKNLTEANLGRITVTIVTEVIVL